MREKDGVQDNSTASGLRHFGKAGDGEEKAQGRKNRSSWLDPFWSERPCPTTVFCEPGPQATPEARPPAPGHSEASRPGKVSEPLDARNGGSI